MADLKVNPYMDGGRAAGRTWKLVQDLPDGGVIIVPSYGPFEQVRSQILPAQNRRHNAVVPRIINTVVAADRALLGMRHLTVGVDHSMSEMPHAVRRAVYDILKGFRHVVNIEALGNTSPRAK